MNRILLFLIPFFFESMVSYFIKGIPFLTIDLGGDQAQIGLISSIIIAAQLPLYFIMGFLTKKFGKYGVMSAGLFLMVVFSILTVFMKNIPLMAVIATICYLGHAIFYPALQALMGDLSDKERMSKDVGIYNMGWCFGASMVGLTSPYICDLFGIKFMFYSAGLCGILASVFLIVNYIQTKNREIVKLEEENNDDNVPKNNDEYLIIGRLGMFLGYFTYTSLTLILPKILLDLNWSESTILFVTGLFVVGQAIGIIGCAFLTFWKGRIFPQYIANIIFILSALLTIVAPIPWVLGTIYFITGLGMSMCYTMALFHAVSSHSSVRAKNTGMHEGVVASGMVGGTLIGSLGGLLVNVTHIDQFKYLGFAFIILVVLFNFVYIPFLSKKIKNNL